MRTLFILSMMVCGVSAQAAGYRLVEIGSADLRNGTVYYKDGKVQLINEDGNVTVPFKNQSKKAFKTARPLTSDLEKCAQVTAKVKLDVNSGESVALFANASVGAEANASVAVVRKKSDSPAAQKLGYYPLDVRVYDGDDLLAVTALPEMVYPCALVLDHFLGDANAEQQVLVAWGSIGGNASTVGVKIYSLHKE